MRQISLKKDGLSWLQQHMVEEVDREAANIGRELGVETDDEVTECSAGVHTLRF